MANTKNKSSAVPRTAFQILGLLRQAWLWLTGARRCGWCKQRSSFIYDGLCGECLPKWEEELEQMFEDE